MSPILIKSLWTVLFQLVAYTDGLDLSWTREPIILNTCTRGVATAGICVFIPPKSAQVNILWGKNDVRTAIQQFYIPQKTFIHPKQISGYAPDTYLYLK